MEEIQIIHPKKEYTFENLNQNITIEILKYLAFPQLLNCRLLNNYSNKLISNPHWNRAIRHSTFTEVHQKGFITSLANLFKSDQLKYERKLKILRVLLKLNGCAVILDFSN